MRHGLRGRKLNRTTSHRKSMFANMAVALIQHEQIKTTLHKAKDLRPIVEKLITIARKGDLATRRRLISLIRSEDSVNKLMGPLKNRYLERPGGYIRIFKAGFRYGDMAPMAVIELVDRESSKKEISE